MLRRRRKGMLLFCTALLGMPVRGGADGLCPKTVAAFDQFARTKEAQIAGRVQGQRNYLWADDSAERMALIRQGQVVVAPGQGKGILHVPDGLIHDWIGSLFIPGVTLQTTLAVVHDYNHHSEVFKPDLLESRVLSQDGNQYRIFARIRKKAVITLVFDAEYDVHYFQLDANRWYSRSYSTRINDVENIGRPDERQVPRDTSLLRRLYTYSRFEQRDDGVYLECEAVSLSRPFPTGLGWLFEPIVRNVSRAALAHMLENTRAAVLRYNSDTRRVAADTAGRNAAERGSSIAGIEQ